MTGNFNCKALFVIIELLFVLSERVLFYNIKPIILNVLNGCTSIITVKI